MERLSFVIAVAAAWFAQGCVSDESSFHDARFGFEIPNLDPELRFELPRFDPETRFEALWKPRAHPPGTLLVDSERELWMVVNWLERRPVAGSDTLAEVGLSRNDAIQMSSEEERCLVPVPDDEYWYPEIMTWKPKIGFRDDDGLYVLNHERGLRRRTSLEAIESHGYYADWLERFNDDVHAWNAFEEVDPPLSFRDGTVVRTENGTYFMQNNEAHPFVPPELVVQAGYRERSVTYLPHSRLEELARIGDPFTREIFSICPADEPIAERNDHDSDGAPFHLDCDDEDSSRHPGALELCNAIDDNCDGLLDEACVD